MSANQTPLANLDTLIFDMDGVLIDVSNSYRQAIIQTVDIFFTKGLGLSYGTERKPLLNNHDIDLLKQAGGFNNDWDITIAFVIYFLEMLPAQSIFTQPLRQDVLAMLNYLQMVGKHLSVTLEEMRQYKHITRLANGVAEMGGGLQAIEKLLKRRNRHLLPIQGTLTEGNLVQRIFQEIYLGPALFETIYDLFPLIIYQAGLIDNETLMINPTTLELLSQRFSLGIATGRPKAEATYSLKRLNIDRYFRVIITHDDIIAADALGKPDPWSLLEAARQIDPQPAYSAYIGDTPDDIQAAKTAVQTMPFLAIGSLAAAADKETLRSHFEEKQADHIIDHPDQLKEILLA